MTLRILDSNAVYSTGVSSGDDLVRSAQLVSSMQSTYPAFAELKHNSMQLLDSAAASAESSLDDLRQILSVLEQLSQQFLRLQPSSNADEVAEATKAISGITATILGKKVTTLFDPRRNEEFFDKLWNSPLLCADDPDTFPRQLPDAVSLLDEAGARTRALISSNERILIQSAVAQENISASNSIPERGTTAMR